MSLQDDSDTYPPYHFQIHFKMPVFFEVLELQNIEAGNFLKDYHARRRHFPDTASSAFWNEVCILLIKHHLQIRDPKPREGGPTSKGTWVNRGKAELKLRVSNSRRQGTGGFIGALGNGCVNPVLRRCFIKAQYPLD